MSSTLRSVAQIPARVKYLVAVAATTDGGGSDILDTTCYSFTCPEGSFAESLISSTAAAAIVTTLDTDFVSVDLAVGDLFKDLGRQLVIYDATSKDHLVIYRAVQEVNGAGDEGVPAAYGTVRYVRVWSADGAGVRVARVGPGAH